MLWRDHRLPWRYAPFLPASADQILLRHVGGGYQFIHRTLQEYLAGLDAEAIAAYDDRA